MFISNNVNEFCEDAYSRCCYLFIYSMGLAIFLLFEYKTPVMGFFFKNIFYRSSFFFFFPSFTDGSCSMIDVCGHYSHFFFSIVMTQTRRSFSMLQTHAQKKISPIIASNFGRQIQFMQECFGHSLFLW
jgi:hypothetical protein